MAAPTDSRFMSTALSGSTIDRSRISRTKKDRPSTNRSTFHIEPEMSSRMSFWAAVTPPTWAVGQALAQALDQRLGLRRLAVVARDGGDEPAVDGREDARDLGVARKGASAPSQVKR